MSAKLNRRDFLKLVAASTGGLVLAVYLEGCASAPTPEPATVTPALPTATATPLPPQRLGAQYFSQGGYERDLDGHRFPL
jgi:hypothetical protein